MRKNEKVKTFGPHRKTPFEKPGNQLYPAPAVLVSCRDPETGEIDVLTVAWTGNICSDPPMLSISVRPERYSYHMIKASGEFVVNLTTIDMCRAVDYCGVKSGRNVDKFAETGLTPEDSVVVSAPSVKESPVSIECRVKQIIPLGSHDLFLAEVVSVCVDEAYITDKGTFCLENSGLMAYSHGKYYSLGSKTGFFGWSVAKKKKKKKAKSKKQGAKAAGASKRSVKSKAGGNVRGGRK